MRDNKNDRDRDRDRGRDRDRDNRDRDKRDRDRDFDRDRDRDRNRDRDRDRSPRNRSPRSKKKKVKTFRPEDYDELTDGEKCCSYARVFIIWCCAFWCGGITPGMNLFLPMFAEAGLAGQVCGTEPLGCKDQYLALTSVLTFCTSVSSIGFLPAGLVFDLIGGRACGAGGAFSVSVGAAILALGLVLDSSAVVCLAILIMDAGALLNNFGFFGCMWHMPEAQGLLMSVACGAVQTPALLPKLLQFFMDAGGLGLVEVFGVYAAINCIAGVVLFFAVPNQNEFFARATFVLGIPMTPPTQSCRFIRNSIWMAGRVVYKQRREVLLVAGTTGFGVAAGTGYYMDCVPFGTAMFGDKASGEALGTFYTQATMVNSVVAAVGMGYLMDYTNVGTASYVSCLMVVLIVTLGSVVNIYPQMLCAAAEGFLVIMAPAVLCRFVNLWCPPHRFGMCQGFVILIFMLIFSTQVTFFNLISAMFDGAAAFTTPMRIFGVIGLVAWTSTANRLSTKKYTTILIGGDEEELMHENFGLKTFEDAEKVLRMDREEILRIMRSTDLDERKKLIEIMKDPDVQLRWAQLCYDKGYELPELSHVEHMYLMVTNLENTLMGIFCCHNEHGGLTPRPSTKDLGKDKKRNGERNGDRSRDRSRDRDRDRDRDRR